MTPKITVAGGATNTAASVSTFSSYPVGILPSPPAGADVEDESPSRPRRSARKPEWVSYATKLGVDVDGLNKKEIIALVGG